MHALCAHLARTASRQKGTTIESTLSGTITHTQQHTLTKRVYTQRHLWRRTCACIYLYSHLHVQSHGLSSMGVYVSFAFKWRIKSCIITGMHWCRLSSEKDQTSQQFLSPKATRPPERTMDRWPKIGILMKFSNVIKVWCSVIQIHGCHKLSTFHSQLSVWQSQAFSSGHS